MNFPQAVPEIPVRSVEHAAEYYSTTLGFTLDWGDDNGGIGGISQGDCRMFLTNAGFRAGRGAPVVIWLNVNSKQEVDDLHRRWRDAGAKILAEPQDKPWKLREFTVADLDDNQLRVFYDFSHDADATGDAAGATSVPSDAARDFLRHTVATLAYRAGKTLRDAPPSFADFALGPGTRTPREILAHMGDLLDWALSMTQGQPVWRPVTPQAWPDEVARFFAALEAFDATLASSAAITPPVLERLFQGPVADALTHTGQLALLRRRADAPVRGENYARADIAIGRTGPEQATARVEFD